MASVPNMRLTPTMSPGPGDGSGEANAAAGFARLLSTLPSETGEATILPAQGDAAEPEGGADEAETLSPADALLSLVGLAFPVPEAAPTTSAAVTTPASPGAAGKVPGSATAEPEPQDLAGIVKTTAPTAAPGAGAPDAGDGSGDVSTPAAPPPVSALADAGDRPSVLVAQAAGSSSGPSGIDLRAAPLRPGLPRSPAPVDPDETPAAFDPKPDVIVGVLRPEFASGAAARVPGRRGAEAADARPPIAARAAGAEARIDAAVAEPAETPGPARGQATSSYAILPTTLGEPAASPPAQAPAPTADLPAPGEAAIERQLDVAADGEWLDQLARDIAGSGSEGRLRFRLNPETLGRLHVELTQTEQGASIRLTTESEAARAVIADAQPRLMAEARAQGVRIAETHVDIGGGQTGDPRRHDSDRRDPLIRTAGRDSHPAETADPRKSSGDRYA